MNAALARPAMTRRTVTLATPQDAYLVAESARLGISVSELARRVLDHYMAGGWLHRDPAGGVDEVATNDDR